MCGIAGFSLSPTEGRVNARRLSAALLYGIENRGYDATGAAWFLSDGKVEVQKAALPARTFIKHRLSVPRAAQMAILHTRFGTQGSEKNNLNNHPIRVGPLVGVHNGMISNDDHLFWVMDVEGERQAQVDSEAIWASLYFGLQTADGSGRKPAGVMRMPRCNNQLDILGEIEGSAALGWFDERSPNKLFLAKTASSPLVFGITDNGSLLFASSLDTIERAAETVRLKLVDSDYFSEGQYAEVVNGSFVAAEQFEPARSYYSFGRGSYKSAWDRDYTPVNRIGFQYVDGAWVETSQMGTTVVTTQPLKTSWLVDRLDPEESIDRDTSLHFKNYVERERAIDKWMADLKSTDQAAITAAAMSTRAFARKGDYVTTTLNGEEMFGQLYELPQSFPEGHYIVKVSVPKDGEYEAVFVRRQFYEFDLLPMDVTKALPMAQSADAETGEVLTDTDEDEQDMCEVTTYDQAPTPEQVNQCQV